MKIAIIGTRGIPAKYGGFETFAEEISKRFAKEGNITFVYGRKKYYEENEMNPEFNGVKTIYLKSVDIKQIETISHTLFSFIHFILKNKPDAVILCNVANVFIIPFLKFFHIKTLINVDGLEWKRDKWNWFGKSFYKLCERIAIMFAKRSIIVDSKEIGRYFKNKYKINPTYISYGAKIIKEEDENNQNDILNQFKIKKNNYFLQITRFVPENNVDLVIKAFKKVNTDKKLVVVGGDNYKSKYYKNILRESKEDVRIILPGFIYDKNIIDTLLFNAYAYIHGNQVGGTNPALLQAMGANNVVLAIDTLFNREVLRYAGYFFNKNTEDTQKTINQVLKLEENDLNNNRLKAKKIIQRYYDWDKVANSYLGKLEND